MEAPKDHMIPLTAITAFLIAQSDESKIPGLRVVNLDSAGTPTGDVLGQ